MPIRDRSRQEHDVLRARHCLRGMRPWVARLLGVTTVVLLSSSALAYCSYHGKMYAKTTVAQEFTDSQWVVRVKVISADDHWPDEGDAWTLYQLQVLTAFKGTPPAHIEMFTYRDSGGFYLDKRATNDLGSDFLLFLNHIPDVQNVPAAARYATEVNYPCGQSKEWDSVNRAEQEHLLRLSHRNRHSAQLKH
jgi:hypothetical protein